jgi:integrase
MVSGAMCRRFESFQARFTFPAKAGNSRNLPFVRRPRYSFPYGREGEELPKRRGNGEGSVYRRKDGLGVGQYKIETPSGAKTKYICSKTRKGAASKLADALAERDSGLVYDCGSVSLGDYLGRWLEATKGTVRERTWIRAEVDVRVHIDPSLGKSRLDRLSALRLQSFYGMKLDSGLSPRTVQIIHATLHKALKQAVRWQLNPRNVAESVDPPKAEEKEIEPLDEGHARGLLKAAEGDELEALYVLAITTGMRSGELLGLKWEDVDFRAETLRVNRTLFNGRVHPPKTSKSRRCIRLSRPALVALKNHGRTGEWVFCTGVGTPISVHNLHNRSWKPLLKKAGLPHERFHDLRHTCATLLLTKGVHPKVVQELLGHSSISVTLDTYSHVLPNMQEKAVAAMDAISEGS